MFILSIDESFIDAIDVVVAPISQSGTKVLKISGDSNGLESGVEPNAAFTKNLEIKSNMRISLELHKERGPLTFVAVTNSAKQLSAPGMALVVLNFFYVGFSLVSSTNQVHNKRLDFRLFVHWDRQLS